MIVSLVNGIQLDGKIQPQYFNAEHKTKQEQRLAYADPLTPQP